MDEAPETAPAEPPRAPPRLNDVNVARIHFLACCVLLLCGLWPLYESGPTIGALVSAFGWIVLGAFTTLIVGTSRMLLAGVLGLRLRGGPMIAFVPATLAILGSVGFSFPQRLGMLAWCWGAGLLVHASLVVDALRRGRPGAGRGLTIAGRSPGIGAPVMAAALAYALAGALVVPLATTGRLGLPVVVHVVLAGFVVGTILGASLLLLPRFTGRPIPRAFGLLVAALALTGPALIAYGLHASMDVLRIGAVVEALGLGGFAAMTLGMLAASGRARPSFAAYAVAALSILVGLGLGVTFAFDASARSLVPVHAVLNLFGFAGLFVIGASTDLYGPSLRQDPRWFVAQSWTTVGLGVAGTLLLALEAAGLGVRGGAVPYGVAVLLHLAGGLRGTVRGLRRPGAPPHGRAVNRDVVGEETAGKGVRGTVR